MSLLAPFFKNPALHSRFRQGFKSLASLRLTVFSLLLLFVLTALGTYHQVDYGLFAAQKRYFYSWFFLLFDFFPFPGAQLVLWVLAVNLIAAGLTRYRYTWSNLGLLLLHWGIFSLLIGAFVTYYYARESVVVLEEGEATNVSLDYFRSELAVWSEAELPADATWEGGTTRAVKAYDTSQLRPGKEIEFKNLSVHRSSTRYAVRLTPLYYYKNAAPANFSRPGVTSVMPYTALLELPLAREREDLLSGGLFRVVVVEEGNPTPLLEENFLLWEGQITPQQLKLNAEVTLFLALQRKRYPLGFSMALQQFIKETHYGTDLASRYESVVALQEGAVKRKARIYMNHPLRLKGYTFFQASFSRDELGNQRSVLATVKNYGFFLPYFSSIVVSLGLMLHFAMKFWRFRKRELRLEKKASH